MIKKAILCRIIGLLFMPVMAQENCFLMTENGAIFLQEGQGDPSARYAPCSTFKVALSLMGYDAQILTDETHPAWPFEEEKYEAFLESWKETQTPTSWMKNSCVWYSQVLTPQIGAERFQNYVTKLNYGNQDVSGDKGKNNGLTHSWLSSSLEISPGEQAVFLEKLLANTLPVTMHAQEMTRNIMFLETLPQGWDLYGKTGSGYLLSDDRAQKLDIKHGWFVGWIQKDMRKIIFVHHIVDDQSVEAYAGLRAKAAAKERLVTWIHGQEK